MVSEGPYRLTRNPMYVAMAGALVAHTVARRSVASALPAAGFVVVVGAAQVRAEEEAMAANFGVEWHAYAATSPRWLSLRSLYARTRSARPRATVGVPPPTGP
ncbi:methyltransferase family protein [Nocardioides perillae]